MRTPYRLQLGQKRLATKVGNQFYVVSPDSIKEVSFSLVYWDTQSGMQEKSQYDGDQTVIMNFPTSLRIRRRFTW